MIFANAVAQVAFVAAALLPTATPHVADPQLISSDRAIYVPCPNTGRGSGCAFNAIAARGPVTIVFQHSGSTALPTRETRSYQCLGATCPVRGEGKVPGARPDYFLLTANSASVISVSSY